MAAAPSAESRRTWATLAAVLPLAFLSLQFAHVFVAPGAGSNREWIDDARVLVKLEFFLLLVAPLVVSIAGRIAEARRVAGLAGMAALLAALLYALWLYSGDATLVGAASALVAGRFVTAVIGGHEARFALLERWAVGVLLYFTLLAFIFLVEPELIDYRHRFIPPATRAVAFCAIYYFLLACIEAIGIAPKWREPVIRRPMRYLREPFPLGGNSVRLEFAGDAVELVSDERIRPSGRVYIAFIGCLFLLFPVVLLFIAGLRAFALLPFWVLTVCGVSIISKSLRRGVDARHVQVRHGEIATSEVSRGLTTSLRVYGAGEIERLEVQKADRSRESLVFARVRGTEWLVPMASGLKDEVTAEAMRGLFDLYWSGDASPRGLRKAFDADRNIPALLGTAVVERLLEAEPQPVRQGSMKCPGCGSEIIASAPRCPYCGLLHPALD